MKSYIASIVSESLYNFFLVIKYSFFFSLVSLLDLVCVDGISHNRDRFELWYMFVDYVQNFRYFVKFRAPIKSKIFSVRNIFESSGWLEREAYDMYGVRFFLHGDLRRILTDYGFKGNPLLKEFPVIGYYELRFDEIYKIIVEELVEVMQYYRFFRFESPWFRWNL